MIVIQDYQGYSKAKILLPYSLFHSGQVWTFSLALLNKPKYLLYSNLDLLLFLLISLRDNFIPGFPYKHLEFSKLKSNTLEG